MEDPRYIKNDWSAYRNKATNLIIWYSIGFVLKMSLLILSIESTPSFDSSNLGNKTCIIKTNICGSSIYVTRVIWFSYISFYLSFVMLSALNSLFKMLYKAYQLKKESIDISNKSLGCIAYFCFPFFMYFGIYIIIDHIFLLFECLGLSYKECFWKLSNYRTYRLVKLIFKTFAFFYSLALYGLIAYLLGKEQNMSKIYYLISSILITLFYYLIYIYYAIKFEVITLIFRKIINF